MRKLLFVTTALVFSMPAMAAEDGFGARFGNNAPHALDGGEMTLDDINALVNIEPAAGEDSALVDPNADVSIDADAGAEDAAEGVAEDNAESVLAGDQGLAAHLDTEIAVDAAIAVDPETGTISETVTETVTKTLTNDKGELEASKETISEKTIKVLSGDQALAVQEKSEETQEAASETAPEKSTQEFDAAAHASEFNAADTDGDGRLSREEAVAANPNVAKEFDAIDADGDGYITPQEDMDALNKTQ